MTKQEKALKSARDNWLALTLTQRGYVLLRLETARATSRDTDRFVMREGVEPGDPRVLAVSNDTITAMEQALLFLRGEMSLWATMRPNMRGVVFDALLQVLVNLDRELKAPGCPKGFQTHPDLLGLYRDIKAAIVAAWRLLDAGRADSKVAEAK